MRRTPRTRHSIVRRRRTRFAPAALAALVGSIIAASARAEAPTVIFNEVHYHPADDLRDGEFLEIHNPGEAAVSLDGWFISGAVRFAFPEDLVLEPDAYRVIAADPDVVRDRYGLDESMVLGPFEGSLENNGERVELWTSSSFLASFVDYQDSEPWPETPDGLGPSVERIAPAREETDARAWAASLVTGGTPGRRNSVYVYDVVVPEGEAVPLVAPNSEWRYFEGTEEPPENWASLEFDDSEWSVGTAGFGYGDDDDVTILDTMQDNYLSLFVRTSFEVDDPAALESITLSVDYDDGFVAYINGVEASRRNVEDTAFDADAPESHEAGSPVLIEFEDVSERLVAGINVLAVAGYNGTIGSSDFSLHPWLSGQGFPPDVEPPPEPEYEPSGRLLVINELSAGGPGTGWVELFNRSGEDVETGDYRVGLFPPSAGEHAIPSGLLSPGEHLVITEEALGFELDEAPVLVLSLDDGRFVDGLNPRATAPESSTGRFPDGLDNRFAFTEPTPGAPNVSPPDRGVVISEIMYHPADENTGGEFIELLNPTPEEVDLSLWSFTRGISFTFEPGTTLAAGERLVLARDPEALAAFHGLDVESVLGPYEGRLQNDAETLLLRDEHRNPIDRVRFADEGSWPEAADGEGPSLELVHPALDNRHGPAWAASEVEPGGDPEPVNAGTPGAPNSTAVADPAPIVVAVEHSPVVPTSTDPVRVLASVTDDTALATVMLFFELDDGGGEVLGIAMTDDGNSDDGVPDNRIFGAEIPALPDGTVVAFWIEAISSTDQTTIVPTDAPRPAFLYQVEDVEPDFLRSVYRLVMRPADLIDLRERGVRVNRLIDITFVADGRAYYNRGVRYRGSSARSCFPLSYRVQFDHDRDFIGIKRLNLNGCNASQQWIGLDFLRRTGIPTPQAWFRRVLTNGEAIDGWHLRVEAIDDSFIERVYPDDADGNLYRGVSRANLDYRGEEFDPYRPHYEKRTNRRADDYSDVVDLSFRFDRETTADEDFVDALEERVDTFQWTTYFGAYALLGSTENSIVLNNGDDYFLYRRFSDDRWVLLPWDLDSCFDEFDQPLFRPTVDAIERLLEHPLYAPDYWCTVEFLLDRVFLEDLINSRIDHLEPLFADGLVDRLRRYVSLRRLFIDQELQRSLELAGVAGGTVCAGVIYPTRQTIDLVGVAPACQTTEVLVNDVPVSYDAVRAIWRGTIEVFGPGELRVEARNRLDVPISLVRYDIADVDAIGDDSLHVQPPGAATIAFKADRTFAITDPDGDGNVWTGVAGVQDAFGAEGRVLRAPEDGEPRTPGQSVAVYQLRFSEPGTYRAYYRVRGFSLDSDSFYAPTDFDVEPDDNIRTNRRGNFTWVEEGDFEVGQNDVDDERIFEFRVGVREFRTELDAIALSLETGLSAEVLEASIGVTPQPPRAVVKASPSTDIVLEDNPALVTLDASDSHDGNCESDGLGFLWEQTGGPGVELDPADAPSVAVELDVEGDYVFRVTVTTSRPVTRRETASPSASPARSIRATPSCAATPTVTARCSSPMRSSR